MAEESRNKYQEWEQRRKEKIAEISRRIEEGMAKIMDSAEFKNYLTVMASFYRYSARNSLLIYMQRPTATLCASYTDWQRKYNRQVNKGEKGIQILAPAPYKMTVERDKLDAAGNLILDKDGNPEKTEKEITVPRFKVVSTFDLSQTSGEPLPEIGIKELSADVEHYEMFMEAIRRIAPVPIRFDEIEGSARGYYDPAKKEIVIRRGMPQEQTMKTCIHELGHSLLHDKDTLKLNGKELKKDRMTMEIEAEGCAFVCLSHFGFENVGEDYSFPYMTSWSSGRDMKELHAALSTIQQTSSEIITGIEKSMREQMLEKDVDRYEIYQIPIGSEARDNKFVPFDEVMKTYGEISRDNYAMVYTAPLKEGDSLDSLYERFNIDPPSDYAGHSLSISDVVVVHQAQEDKAYYVDSIGFKEIPFKEGEAYVPGWDKRLEQEISQMGENEAEPKRIADDLPPRSRRDSVLKSLREKQQKVNAGFGLISMVI